MIRTVNLAVFLVSMVVVAVVVNMLAAHPTLRLRADTTKTRAYSLSEQTVRLLDGLEGEWQIALVLASDGLDQALARQADEVLQRFDEASETLDVVRIDPTDPASLDQYDALLRRLRVVYRDRIGDYEKVIAEARETLAGYGVFSQQEAGGLVALRQSLADDTAARADVDQILAAFALRQEELRQIDVELDKALRADETRPLPDYEYARSLLALALGRWGDEVYQIVTLFGQYSTDEATELPLRQYIAVHRADYDRWAHELALRADPLKHLEPLELGRVTRSLESGDTAIVFGPHGAAAVPPKMLLPEVLRARGADDERQVAFDRRFRGEHAIAATIRSLTEGGLPVVLLVHAETESPLKPTGQNHDLAGAQQMLADARIEVREWNVMTGERPRPPTDVPVVWMVMPTATRSRRNFVSIDESEMALADATRSLLDAGEPVLLTIRPSLPSAPGQADPWPSLLAPFGIEVNPREVLFERSRDLDGNEVVQPVHQVEQFPAGHPISAAVHGLPTALDFPVALRPVANANVSVIAAAEPDADRWLEPNWLRPPDQLSDDARLDESVALVAAAERINPVGDGRQRLLVVGSGGWAQSYLSDAAYAMGGDRMVLLYPGNYELLLAGVAWLAGADDLIAPSPISRQVSRLTGIDRGARRIWGSVTMIILPAAWLTLGVVVWLVRRR